MACDELITYFLGAGFSRCVTNCIAPLMSGFFRELKKEQFPLLHSFIVNTCGSTESANLQEIVCALDQFCDVPFRRERKKEFLGDLQPDTLLSDIASFAIELLAPLDWSEEHWAANLLAAVDQNCTVITTNYDTLAEQILAAKVDAVHCGPSATCSHCRMRDILLTCCACNLVDRVGTPWRGSLVKLHGSIAWQQCINGKCNRHGCIFPDCRCQPDKTRLCDYCRAATKPALLQPAMLKRYSQYPGIFAMWEAAKLAISEASELVIFGFSFPPTDLMVRQLFRQSLATGKLNKVSIIDLKPEAVREQFEPLVPKHLKVTYDLLPAMHDNSEPKWWNEETLATS